MTGHVIEQVVFDYAVSLADDTGALLRLEQDVEVTTPEGTVTVDPEHAAAHAPLFVALLHRVVLSAVADEDGTLRVTVGGGPALVVRPNERYEAWTFTSHSGRDRVVCLPGGGLATWS
jgi:hypothetical protein